MVFEMCCRQCALAKAVWHEFLGLVLQVPFVVVLSNRVPVPKTDLREDQTPRIAV